MAKKGKAEQQEKGSQLKDAPSKPTVALPPMTQTPQAQTPKTQTPQVQTSDPKEQAKQEQTNEKSEKVFGLYFHNSKVLSTFLFFAIGIIVAPICAYLFSFNHLQEMHDFTRNQSQMYAGFISIGVVVLFLIGYCLIAITDETNFNHEQRQFALLTEQEQKTQNASKLREAFEQNAMEHGIKEVIKKPSQQSETQPKKQETPSESKKTEPQTQTKKVEPKTETKKAEKSKAAVIETPQVPEKTKVEKSKVDAVQPQKAEKSKVEAVQPQKAEKSKAEKSKVAVSEAPQIAEKSKVDLSSLRPDEDWNVVPSKGPTEKSKSKVATEKSKVDVPAPATATHVVSEKSKVDVPAPVANGGSEKSTATKLAPAPTPAPAPASNVASEKSKVATPEPETQAGKKKDKKKTQQESKVEAPKPSIVEVSLKKAIVHPVIADDGEWKQVKPNGSKGKHSVVKEPVKTEEKTVVETQECEIHTSDDSDGFTIVKSKKVAVL